MAVRKAAIFLLAKAVARRSRTKQKTPMEAWATNRPMYISAADILDQRGGFGGLGSRPDYFAGAKYIDATETIGADSAFDVPLF